jgi:hypothetical protein
VASFLYKQLEKLKSNTDNVINDAMVELDEIVEQVARFSLWLLQLCIDLMKYQRLEVRWGCAV